MKVVLFCGGMGMRMREVSSEIPKPLIPICGVPIVVHLMKYYIHYGHDDFILCLGYLGGTFETYFKEFATRKIPAGENGSICYEVALPGEGPKHCRVTLVHTGQDSNIGERLRKVEPHLRHETAFMVNYADGLSDLDLNAFAKLSLAKKKIVSLIAVRPRQSFHLLTSNEEGELVKVEEMGDSPLRINGGFFIIRPGIFEYMRENEDLLCEPFQRLIDMREVITHPHNGFWACMDSLKEKLEFEERCNKRDMPWQVWRQLYPSEDV